MNHSALPPVHIPSGTTPPIRLIADLLATVVPGDRRAALALVGAQ